MNAPDKIYVNFPFGEEHPWRGPMVTKQGLNRHDTIYIRKDALLEWAKEKKQQLLEQEAIEYAPSDVAAGMYAGFDMIIDKLNSM